MKKFKVTITLVNIILGLVIFSLFISLAFDFVKNYGKLSSVTGAGAGQSDFGALIKSVQHNYQKIKSDLPVNAVKTGPTK